MPDTLTFAERQHIARDFENTDKSTPSVNVGQIERIGSLAIGGLMLFTGLRRGGFAGLLAASTAAGFLYRGATGHCTVYKALDMDTAVIDEIGVHVEKSVTINKPAAELYNFWRDFSNLPRFMHHLDSVEVLSDKMSRWTANAPAHFTVSWDAEIISDIPNESITWHSLENAQVTNAGSVRFVPAPGNRGTEVHVSLSYNPPAGSVGVAVAKLFGEEPAQQVEKDLHRFKSLMETGEIPTTQGQPAGDSLKRRLKSGLMPSAVSRQVTPAGITNPETDPNRRWLGSPVATKD